jgi:hypothetical protein
VNAEYETWFMTPILAPTIFRWLLGFFKLLNAELNPICHLLALLEVHHILHVSKIRVNLCNNDPVGSRRLRIPDFKIIGT